MAAMSISSADNRTNPGFLHMAAALLAMEHFNQRNTSVVPQLQDFVDCNFQIDLNNSKVFDSGTVTHIASRSLFQEGPVPCAIAGPFHDVPALDLSVMAQVAEFPIVVHRSFNLRTILNSSSPFSSQVS